MASHDYDQFYWCKACGQSAQDAHERGDYRCLATTNVVAISSQVRTRKLSALVQNINDRYA